MQKEKKIDKVQSDLHFLMSCFKEVLIELKEDDLAASLPWIEGNKISSYFETEESNLPLRASQALSISFQLLNMVGESISKDCVSMGSAELKFQRPFRKCMCNQF